MAALDERDYDRALRDFDQYYKGAAEIKDARADGALYWKAYALSKPGRRDDSLAMLAQLEKSYPSSRWLNDAKALQLEVRQASGQGGSPESQTDEDLKLLAINSLMNTDAERVVPLLEKLLADPKLRPGSNRAPCSCWDRAAISAPVRSSLATPRARAIRRPAQSCRVPGDLRLQGKQAGAGRCLRVLERRAAETGRAPLLHDRQG
jgi:hypothetical protein